MRNNLPEGAQPWAKQVSKTLRSDKKTLNRSEANQRAKTVQMSVGGSRLARVDSNIADVRTAEDRLSDLEGSLTGTVEGIDEVLNDPETGISTRLDAAQEAFDEFVPTVDAGLEASLQAAQQAAADALQAKDDALQAHTEAMQGISDAAAALAKANKAEGDAASAATTASTAKTDAAAAQASADQAKADATSKSAAAEAAAKTYAQAQAASAEAAAKAAASTDATVKADAAQAAAEAAAALDAKTKADAAQAAAEAKAATAQTRAEQAFNNAGAAQERADLAKSLADAAQVLAAKAEGDAASADGKAVAAQSAATAAQGSAQAAQSKADSAFTNAATAQNTASSAATAASNAQTKADTAASDLLALAGKTGRVIRSTTAPTGDDRNVNNLWLNTSNGQLSQWTGSAWSVVTDSRLTAAANAATAAQTTADQAKTNAATAQSKADQAFTDAAAAKTAANNAAAAALGAQSTADTANAKASTADGRVTVGSANPVASDGVGKPVNAIWEVKSGSTVLRRFMWTGTAWTLVAVGQDFIGEKAIGTAQIGDAAVGTMQVADASIVDAKIGDLSVAKLRVTGGAQIPTAVIETLIGQDAFYERMAANQMIVTPGNLLMDPSFKQKRAWSNSSYVQASGGRFGGGSLLVPASAAQQGAYTGTTASSMVYNPRVVAGIKYKLSVYFNSAPASSSGDKIIIYYRWYKEDGTIIGSGTEAANAATFSANSWTLLEGETIECPVGATRLAFGLYVNPGHNAQVRFSDPAMLAMTGDILIEDGAVSADKLAAEIALVTRLIAGPEDGFHTELDQTGIKFRSKLAGVTNPIEILKINTPGTDSDGDVFTLLNPNDLSESTMSVNEAGQGSFSDLQSANSVSTNALIVGGRTLDEILWEQPRGEVARGSVKAPAGKVLNAPSGGKGFDLAKLKFVAEPGRSYHIIANGPLLNVSGNEVGALVTINGAEVDRSRYLANGWSKADADVLWSLTGSVATEVEVGFRIQMYLSTATVHGVQAHIDISVQDVGPLLENSAEVVPLVGDNAPAPVLKQTYTKTWNTAWLRTFPTSSFYAGKAAQGTWNGTTFRGFLGFPNMLADIGSAEIVKIEVYVYMSHWYYNSGGTLSIQGHGQLLEPTAQPGVSGTVVSLTTGKPGGGWVTLPAAYYAGFKAGTLRGIALVGSGLAAYGYATSGQIRVTYKK